MPVCPLYSYHWINITVQGIDLVHISFHFYTNNTQSSHQLCWLCLTCLLICSSSRRWLTGLFSDEFSSWKPLLFSNLSRVLLSSPLLFYSPWELEKFALKQSPSSSSAGPNCGWSAFNWNQRIFTSPQWHFEMLGWGQKYEHYRHSHTVVPIVGPDNCSIR